MVRTSSARIGTLVGVLRKLVPLAAAVARAVRRLALASAAAAAVIAFALLRGGLPDSLPAIVLTLVVLALAAAPPLVLFLFSAALRELAELPERLERMPETGREHAAELRKLANEARSQQRAGLFRVPLLLWRARSLVRSSRELLTPYAPLLPFASVPFLAATAVAALAALVEIAVALVLLVVLAVT